MSGSKRRGSIQFKEDVKDGSSQPEEWKQHRRKKSEEAVFEPIQKFPNEPMSVRSLSGMNLADDFNAGFDKYTSLEQVTSELQRAGLQSTNLILGIDYTSSNEENGQYTFGGKSLHEIGTAKNPYQRVIEILGSTLAPFDKQNFIPTFGFGDEATTNESVFPFFADRTGVTFREVLAKYEEITSRIQLSGPTNFGPLIREAILIVRESRLFHILVIIADGQVVNEIDTANAIVEASHYPLSILTVGVGDGPWSMMEFYAQNLPQRKFENFKFINFHDIVDASKSKNPESAFAMAALSAIPDQYLKVKQLGYID